MGRESVESIESIESLESGTALTASGTCTTKARSPVSFTKGVAGTAGEVAGGSCRTDTKRTAHPPSLVAFASAPAAMADFGYGTLQPVMGTKGEGRRVSESLGL